MKQSAGLFLAILALCVIVLFVINIFVGSVSIAPADVWNALVEGNSATSGSAVIIWQLRLPSAVVALFAGAALGVSGLMMQTVFQNPLADPSLLGVSSGASLGVALAMLVLGGTAAIGGMSIGGSLLILIAAFAGAMAVTALLTTFSAHIGSKVVLLIVGLMLSYGVGAIISLLAYFAPATGVQSYFVWGLGSFGSVSTDRLPIFCAVTTTALALCFTYRKQLNALLLGDDYAANLGVNIRLTRTMLLLLIGVLTSTTTAFCGPIAFLGIASPHMVRLVTHTSHHRVLLPGTMLCGSAIALLCQSLTSLPTISGHLPINVITPLIGVPVMLRLLTSKYKGL